MKKRLLCMILCAVLVAGLAMPAFAEGEGETRSGFIIGENFYDYATPVSGDGWSYDGNYRITFSGISLATPDYPYTNYTSFQFCNPPCDLTVVLADGTSSSFNSFDTMYRIGKASVDAAKITFEGSGALTCHQFVIGPVEINGSQINSTYFACGDMILNGGALTTTRLTIQGEYDLNSGSILVEGGDYRYESCLRINMDYVDDGNAVVSLFKDKYGQPHKLVCTTYDWGNAYTVVDSKGENSTYASWSSGDTPEPAADMTAYASTQFVNVDGEPVEFQMYALKDKNGNPTNYVKARDVAYVLSGTEAQFNVGWDGSANLIAGESYDANGSEMSTPFSGDREYKAAASATNVNGKPAELEAIMLFDDNGGGYTYYKLRDLGAALGFNVGWSAELGAYIETDKPYEG